jgi:ABC-type antimicrobial peptide transport system permease subunit
MALGAKPASVQRLVVWQGLQMTLLGMFLGLVGAAIFGRYLVSVLYGVKLGDPWTIAGVLATILMIALVACFVPARRAASIDPLEGLRAE